MPLNTTNLIPALTLCLLSNSTDASGPPPIEQLPAETRWVLHVNVESLVESHLGRSLFEANEGQPLLFDEGTTWHDVQQELEIDPRTDLKSFTLYNAGEVDADTVVMLVTSAKIDELIDMLPDLMPSYRAMAINGHEVHSWTEVIDDERKRWHAHVRSAERPDRRLCVISENWEQLLIAIERVTRPARDADNATIADPLPGPGSLIYAAGTGMGEINDDDEWLSRIARFARSFVVDVREHDGKVDVLTIVRGDTADEMTNLAQMLQGLVAMANMALGEDDDLEGLRPILREIRITSKDNALQIRLQVPIEVAVTGVGDAGILVDSRMEDRSFKFGVGARIKPDNRGDGEVDPNDPDDDTATDEGPGAGPSAASDAAPKLTPESD